MLNVLWPHSGSQGHLRPLDPEAKKSTCSISSLGRQPKGRRLRQMPPRCSSALQCCGMQPSTTLTLLGCTDILSRTNLMPGEGRPRMVRAGHKQMPEMRQEEAETLSLSVWAQNPGAAAHKPQLSIKLRLITLPCVGQRCQLIQGL